MTGSKEITGNKRIGLVVIMFIVLLGLAALVLSLSFISNPQINSGETVYTDNDLVCSWQASADTTLTNVTWYKNDVAQFTFSVGGETHTLTAGNTTKHDEWMCEVLLYNATDVLPLNISVNISNSAQTRPKFTLLSIPLTENYTIYEDDPNTFYINSSDVDGDVLSYRIIANDVCTLDDEDTGESTCTASHLAITGSSTPGPEVNTTYKVVFWADDNIEYVNIGNNFTFTLIPVNDQATFTESISDVSIEAETPFQIFVNGSDEENDESYDFVVASTLDSAFPGLVILNSFNATVGNLTINTANHAPTNAHVGNWTVYVNITDNESSNATRSPSQLSFTLEILTTNHDPGFATSFNNTEGTQGQSFLAYIYANDTDSGDTLAFSLENPSASNETCSLPFPWSISTTNTSNLNGTGLISLTLNNTHVACDYVVVNVTDSSGGMASRLVYFNITNVNDPPTMYEVGENGNISIQSTYLYVSYEYQVNATDVDNFTYDSASTGTLTYTLNDTTIFNIGSSTGLITGNPQSAGFVGNWSINVSASDGTYTSFRILNITIIGNNPPVINVSSNNFTLPQNQSILINFTSRDSDNNTMSVNYTSLTGFANSIYSIYNYSNDYSGGENLATWIFNVSKSSDRLANDMVGNHSVLLNVSDSFNASDAALSTDILNFTISNVNDAPFFDANLDNSSDSVSFGVVVVNNTFSKVINATDYDLFVQAGFASENLTFSYSNASPSISSINFTKIGPNSALLSFIVDSEGNRSISLAVTDDSGSTVIQNMSFEVFLYSAPPTYLEIKPYYNTTLNNTLFEFVNATPYIATKTVSVNVSENTTAVFDAMVIMIQGFQIII